MKTFIYPILLFVTLLIFQDAYPQSGKVPPFRMLQSNGKIFRAEELPIGKPIVIIYFSPDCEDCQKLTKDLLARMNDFKDVSFAMITYQTVENVRAYVVKNKLNNYSNIFIGTEGSSLFVRNFYNIMKFPFMTLYNKNGDLIVKYQMNEINLDDMYSRIKALSGKP
jgi:thiol-disulfide isomerase/thioredoxin